MADHFQGPDHRGPRPEHSGFETEVQRFRRALEDILALAHAAGEPSERAVAMQRRAIAALSGRDAYEPPREMSEIDEIRLTKGSS